MDPSMRDLLCSQARTEPLTIDLRESVTSAVKLMNERSAGSILVTERARMVGILTERDVLTRVIESGCDPATVEVQSVMTRDPVSIAPEATVRDAIQRMRDFDVRHLPILDSGTIVGIVCMRDIIWALAHALGMENRQLHDYIHGPTPAVAEPYF